MNSEALKEFCDAVAIVSSSEPREPNLWRSKCAEVRSMLPAVRAMADKPVDAGWEEWIRENETMGDSIGLGDGIPSDTLRARLSTPTPGVSVEKLKAICEYWENFKCDPEKHKGIDGLLFESGLTAAAMEIQQLIVEAEGREK